MILSLREVRRRPVRPMRTALLTIAGGSAVGQLAALLGAPFLTRLYSPVDFGQFAVLTSIVITLGTIGAARFDLAVPLPPRETDAYSVALLGLIASLLLLVFSSMTILLAGDVLSGLLGQPQLMPWLWAVPVCAASMSASLVLNQLALRHQRFRAVARRNLIQSVVLIAAQLILGLLQVRPGGLILGFAIGQALGMVSLLFGAGLFSRAAKEGATWPAVRRMAARYRKFPLVSAPSGLLNVLAPQLPILMVSQSYGLQVAGWLGLAQRVLTAPVTLVGTAVAQVYLSELARRTREADGEVLRMFRRATHVLTVAATGLALVLLLAGPVLFSWIFGEEWRTSGEYARALSLGVAAQLVAAPLSPTMIVFEKQFVQLLWDAGRVLTMLGVLLVFPQAGADAQTTIWAVGTVTALTYLASWILSRRTLIHAARGKPGRSYQPEKKP